MPIPQSDIGEFLDNLPEGFLVADSKGVILFVNERLCTMFEYPAEELVGARLATLIPPDSRDTHEQERNAFFRNPHPRAMGHGRDLRGLRKDGTEFPIEVSLAPISSELVYALVSDITGRKSIERSLEEERNFTSAVLETLGALVVVLDTGGRIVRFNRACQVTTGYTLDDVQGKRVWELIPEDELGTVQSAFDSLVAGRFPNAMENHWLTRNGGRRLIAWSNTAITDSSGNVKNVVATGIDVTERRRLEEQYVQAQKMEAVGRLAGGVAHDFNNVLSVISFDSELLMDRLEDPEARELLEEISKVIDRGASIVRELLTFSRPQAIQPVVLDLYTVVQEALRMLEVLVGKTVRIEFQPDGKPAEVRIDRSQMEQVLMNLAANARDAMPNGGTLGIEIGRRHVDAGLSRVIGVGPGEFVLLAVRDSGTGIEPEVRERIFEPFFTTKEVGKGTGLGLSTTYGIITRAGGTIECKSEVGRGTTFEIFLPVLDG